MKNLLDEIWYEGETITTPRLIHPPGCDCRICQTQALNSTRESFLDEILTADEILEETFPSAVKKYRKYAIKADPFARSRSGIDLADAITRMLDFKKKNKMSIPQKNCVNTSFFHFTEALKQFDIKLNKYGRYEFPVLFRQNLTKVYPLHFLLIWFSNNGHKSWGNIPPRYRGAGAPGALLYAGLAENNKLIPCTQEGWPKGLKPGAFLQLWKDEQTYKTVRDRQNTKLLGHSCIFRRYTKNANTIIVSDQSSIEKHRINHIERELTWGGKGWVPLNYLIAANPGKVFLLPVPRA